MFYELLFEQAPQTRGLFPANLEPCQSRMFPALVHVVQMVDQPHDPAPFLAELGRDHRKFGVTAQQYEAVGTALLGAIAHCCGQAWTPFVAEAWAKAYATVARQMIAAAQAERGPACWLGTVVAHRRLARNLAITTVHALEPIPYHAGQYLSVEIPQRPRLWRYLSPANPPRADGLLQFHVRAVEGGSVSPVLAAHTQVGDTWRIGPPMGQLHRSIESTRHLLMIAGGTGVAPVKALVARLASQGNPQPTCVIVGGRTWNDLYPAKDLSELARHEPWLSVVPVIDPYAGQTERVALAEAVSRHGPWTEHEVVVSGSPAMIQTMVSALLTAGIAAEHIHHDPVPSETVTTTPSQWTVTDTRGW